MDIVQPAKTQKVSDRWKAQYCRKDGWAYVMLTHHLGSAQIIYDQIVAIEQSRSKNKLDKIDKVIGNTGWTHHSCNECRVETRSPLVQFDVGGGEYGHNLCIPCLHKVLNLLEKAK